MTSTKDRIQELRRFARVAGDFRMVEIATIALGGEGGGYTQYEAWNECVSVLDDAEVQS